MYQENKNTEEALEHFNIASTSKRVWAFVIDDMFMIFLLLVIFYEQLSAIVARLPEIVTPESLDVFQQELNTFSSDNLLMVVALKVIYHSILVWQNGMTLGKYIMKIKVVDLYSGQYPRFSQALFRAILRIGSEVIFYLGFVMAYFTPLKQTLHDKVSSCVVVDA